MMRLRLLRPLLTAAALFVCAMPAAAAAQQIPVNPQWYAENSAAALPAYIEAAS